MKKRVLLLSAAVLVIGLLVVITEQIINNYSSVLKINWGVSLPSKAVFSEVYSTQTEGSFHGDGLRYHVYNYKYEDYIDSMFLWSPVEHKTRFHPTYHEAADTWLEKLDVPQEFIPRYSHCSYWYQTQDDSSELIIFWNSEVNRLYIVESLL